MTTLSKPLPVPRVVKGRRLHLRDMQRSRVMELKAHWLEKVHLWETQRKGRKTSAKTVRKGLSMAAAIVEQSLHDFPAGDELQRNPFHHLWRTVERREGGRLRPRTAFEVEELNRLFASRLFAEGPDARDPMEVSMYWSYLVGAFTGARLEEIAHLESSDSHELNGRWWMRIEAKSDKERLKTESSFRHVPLHRELLEAGFVAYAAAARQHGWHKLFPWPTADKDSVSGGYGGDAFPLEPPLDGIDRFRILGLKLENVRAAAGRAPEHVTMVLPALALGRSRWGFKRRPSKLPAFLQALAREPLEDTKGAQR